MNTAMSIFYGAKSRGDEYVCIMQKRFPDSPNLTFAVTGTWGKVQFAKMDFCGSGPYSGGNNWGYSYVAILNTNDPWEEHAAYLRAVDFEW